MAAISQPSTVAPRVHHLLEACFVHLAQAAFEQLPQRTLTTPTRMTAAHPEVRLSAHVLDEAAPVVIADVARGGIVPSYVVQQQLLLLLQPDAVRVDHLYFQRVAGPDGHVAGVTSSGSKIGGPLAGATLIVPDPMGATGSSICRLFEAYREQGFGEPARRVLLHLIVTPEYLRRVTTAWPEAEIYALRVDRGASSPEVLNTTPGERWAEESGLDAHDYILPGAGGLGELINNAWV